MDFLNSQSQKRLRDIIDSHFDQIVVKAVDMVDSSGADHDLGYLSLLIPTSLIRNYRLIKNGGEGSITADQFWDDVGSYVVEKLRTKNPKPLYATEDLRDVLDYIASGAYAEYAHRNAENVTLILTETYD